MDAKNVRQAIEALSSKYGETFRERLLRGNGELKEFVRVFLNDEDIRFLGELDAQTRPDDRLLFVPAVAGG